MNVHERNIRLIFGIKVKQFRQAKGFSFKSLSEKSGMSVSYLNEIEKGKKYPKTDKIIVLARALGVSYDELVSSQLDKRWQPIVDLLNSDFFNSLPLHMFGLDILNILEIISTAPAKINAFISTVLKISRNYEMTREHFYFAALRSYQEMHNNYFEELEEEVEKAVEKFAFDLTPPVQRSQIYDVLKDEYGYTIDRETLNQYDSLKGFRSVFIEKTRRLLINDTLTNTQKSFLLGKELAFNFLNLKERPHTSSMFRVSSFEEVLNNFKASYFSVALLLNRRMLLNDIGEVFGNATWEESDFLAVMNKYHASPEMFLHRMISLMTHHYQIKDLFFIRLNNKLDDEQIRITKELHLSQLHEPHRNELNEHYCRRWVSVRTLQELKKMQLTPELAEIAASTILGVASTIPSNGSTPPRSYLIDSQISSYSHSKKEYFCISIARGNDPTPNTNVSTTLGILMDAQSKSKLRFLNDPNIQKRIVNETCERCGLTDCRERVSPPTHVEHMRQQELIEDVLAELNR
ncbi:MAG: helix-turn-helix transcriptional regulator [Bacteroidota bacterium]